MRALPITPTTATITISGADTQASYELPANTVSFSLKSRNGSAFRLAFVTGKVATPTDPYSTIDVSSAYTSPEGSIIKPSTTIYVAAEAADTIEVVSWQLYNG